MNPRSVRLLLALSVLGGMPGCVTWPIGLQASAAPSAAAPAVSARPADSIHVSCLNVPDPGPCKDYRLGYFYDYRTDRCRAFAYGGCGGKIPFANMESCLKACGGQPDPTPVRDPQMLRARR